MYLNIYLYLFKYLFFKKGLYMEMMSFWNQFSKAFQTPTVQCPLTDMRYRKYGCVSNHSKPLKRSFSIFWVNYVIIYSLYTLFKPS